MTDRKPLNAFALLVWVLALVFLATDICFALSQRHLLALSSSFDTSTIEAAWQNLLIVWQLVRSAIFIAVMLATCGVVVELLDGIRWGLADAAGRAWLKPRYLLSRIGRARGFSKDAA